MSGATAESGQGTIYTFTSFFLVWWVIHISYLTLTDFNGGRFSARLLSYYDSRYTRPIMAEAITTTSPDPYEKLHHKQRRFIEEYLIDHNATAAYMRAGYVASRAGAGRSAHVLLKNPDIQAALKLATDELIDRVRLRQDEIHSVLRTLAQSDVKHYTIDDAGNVDVAPGVDPSATRAISSIQRKTITKVRDGETETTHDVKLTLWNKVEATRIAAQTQGMLTPDKDSAAVDPQAANNNYYLTLIQMVQKNGIKSKVGAEDFRSPQNDDAIEIEPVVNGKNGHTNGKS